MSRPVDRPCRTAGGPALPAVRGACGRQPVRRHAERVRADGRDCARGHVGFAEPPGAALGSGSCHHGSAHAASRRRAWSARWAWCRPASRWRGDRAGCSAAVEV